MLLFLKKKKEIVSQVESQGGVPNPNEQLTPEIKAEGDPSGQRAFGGDDGDVPTSTGAAWGSS